MADDGEQFCPECGRLSPPYVQVCLCGHRFPPKFYASPTGYTPYPPPPPPDETNGREGIATAGMVFSIVGVVSFLLWPVALTCSVVGLVLSGAGVNSKRRGMAIAGLVCGIIALPPAICSALGLFEIVKELWKQGPPVRVISQYSSGTDHD